MNFISIKHNKKRDHFWPHKITKTAFHYGLRFKSWQGQKDLNPRHTVLETVVLPTELYPYWWCANRDSNPGPTGYEPVALTNWAKGPNISIAVTNVAAIPLAPPVGFEPTTLRLTAACSTCWAKEAKAKGLTCAKPFDVGIDLSSRSVSRQVLSALVSLTSVFGMGTGGPSPLKTPTAFGTHQILHYYALIVKSFFKGKRISSPCGTPSGTRTLDTLIKSQVLYQLS